MNNHAPCRLTSSRPSEFFFAFFAPPLFVPTAQKVTDRIRPNLLGVSNRPLVTWFVTFQFILRYYKYRARQPRWRWKRTIYDWLLPLPSFTLYRWSAVPCLIFHVVFSASIRKYENWELMFLLPRGSEILNSASTFLQMSDSISLR